MFKVGDYVRFKREYARSPWYSPNTYKIISIDESDIFFEVTLNGYYQKLNNIRLNKILGSFIEIDVKANRKAKLNKIFNG